DPGSGRFVSRDPIGLAGGINAYGYAPNPLNWVDPLGLAGCSAQFRSRNAAFRAAKRDAGIPMNQQPDRIFNPKTGFYGDHRNVPMTDSRKNLFLMVMEIRCGQGSINLPDQMDLKSSSKTILLDTPILVEWEIKVPI
ncbi:MAG: RHS repeat-associated core domain-containing protein, partial [Rhodocyclaceae bacterium]